MMQDRTIDRAERSANFEKIARAIRYLAEHHEEQPDLEEAARVACLSPFHFQREFTRLAGVSPKSFVGHLTLEHAKDLLKNGASVLDAAYGAGLSAPSRLHDLCLKVEAMTPGQFAKDGEGLSIAYDFHPSLFGTALLMATETGLCGLAFGDEDEEDAMFDDMRLRWKRADFIQAPAMIAPYAVRVLSPSKERHEIPVQLFGTPWQIKVWQALLDIPEGAVTSYGALAKTLGDPKASRATGTAVGRNPISLLIPCHRVLAGSGAITGYHWGLTRKRAMLALEAAHKNGTQNQRPSTSVME